MSEGLFDEGLFGADADARAGDRLEARTHRWRCDAAAHVGRGRRPGPPAAPGARCAAWWKERPGLGAAVRAARYRQDHLGEPGFQGDRRHFVALSALSAGVKEVRSVITEARRRLGSAWRATVLFIDEVHRFSRTQQTPCRGGGGPTVLLVAATTENPSFSVVALLLSRSLVLQLRSLGDEDVRELLRRAVADERGAGRCGAADPGGRGPPAGPLRRGRPASADRAGGRRIRASTGSATIDLATVEATVDRAAVLYDRTGDQHYDVASAFIKSIRGSDVDAACTTWRG